MSRKIFYTQLMRNFLSKSLDTEEFQREFLENFKAEGELFKQEEYKALEGVFYSLDMYSPEGSEAFTGAVSYDELVSDVAQVIKKLS